MVNFSGVATPSQLQGNPFCATPANYARVLDLGLPQRVTAPSSAQQSSIAIQKITRARVDVQYAAPVVPEEASYLFISYRAEDGHDAAQSLCARARARFGENRVFMDTSAIRGGTDYPRAIQEALEQCTCMLVIIGPNWLSARDPNSFERRLDQADDWIRREVAQALQRSAGLIPILLHATPNLSEELLPKAIGALANHQSMRMRRDSWERDIDAILATLVEAYGFPVVENATSAATARAEPLRRHSIPGSTTSAPARLLAYLGRVMRLAALAIAGLLAYLVASSQPVSVKTVVGVATTSLLASGILAMFLPGQKQRRP